MRSDKKDEYDRIYDYDDDDDNSTNYEDPDENGTPEEVVEKLRGTIGRGDCLICGGRLIMEYDGNICFTCSKCGMSVHEDTYY